MAISWSDSPPGSVAIVPPPAKQMKTGVDPNEETPTLPHGGGQQPWLFQAPPMETEMPRTASERTHSPPNEGGGGGSRSGSPTLSKLLHVINKRADSSDQQLYQYRTESHQHFVQIQTDMGNFYNQVGTEFAAVREDVQNIKTSFQEQITALKGEIESMKNGAANRSQSAPPGRYGNMPAAAIGADYFEVKANGWAERTRFRSIEAVLKPIFDGMQMPITIVQPPVPYPKFLFLRFESLEDRADFLKLARDSNAPLLIPDRAGIGYPVKFANRLPEFLVEPNKEVRFCAWKLRSVLENLNVDVKSEVLSSLRDRELCVADYEVVYFCDPANEHAQVKGLDGGQLCVNLTNFARACAKLGVDCHGAELVDAINERFANLVYVKL